MDKDTLKQTKGRGWGEWQLPLCHPACLGWTFMMGGSR